MVVRFPVHGVNVMTHQRNRERVTAEITLFHLMRLASERGRSVSREQAIAFLNQERAQEMWQHMMQAGLDFIACSLLDDAPAWNNLPRACDGGSLEILGNP